MMCGFGIAVSKCSIITEIMAIRCQNYFYYEVVFDRKCQIVIHIVILAVRIFKVHDAI